MPTHSVPDELVRAFRNGSSFFIFSHIEPDGDALAPAIALGKVLQALGKRVRLFNAGPFARREIRALEGRFELELTEEIPSDTTCVVLDCSAADRLGPFADAVSASFTLVIDHHASGKQFGDIRFVRPEVPATALLVQDLIEALGVQMDAEIAELLLFAVGTDTGFFRHLDPNHADTFSQVERLCHAGASPKRVYADIYGNRSLASRLLLGRLLARVESYFDDRFLFTYETIEDTNRFGLYNRDSDSLYQLLLGVDSCEVIALIREDPEGGCSGSLRSRTDLDVASIASKLGGGGHKQAAGFHSTESIPVLREQLRSTLSAFFRHKS
jgi:phosphoesterase RecJ-like protein